MCNTLPLYTNRIKSVTAEDERKKYIESKADVRD